MTSRIQPRIVRLTGRRTSVRLEPEFWDGINDIAAREGLSPAQLLQNIEKRA